MIYRGPSVLFFGKDALNSLFRRKRKAKGWGGRGGGRVDRNYRIEIMSNKAQKPPKASNSCAVGSCPDRIQDPVGPAFLIHLNTRPQTSYLEGPGSHAAQPFLQREDLSPGNLVAFVFIKVAFGVRPLILQGRNMTKQGRTMDPPREVTIGQECGFS